MIFFQWYIIFWRALAQGYHVNFWLAFLFVIWHKENKRPRMKLISGNLGSLFCQIRIFKWIIKVVGAAFIKHHLCCLGFVWRLTILIIVHLMALLILNLLVWRVIFCWLLVILVKGLHLKASKMICLVVLLLCRF